MDILKESTKKDYIIYFDMDDTLTDYSYRLKNTVIDDPETGENRPIKPSDTSDNKDFWTSAQWLPGSKEMIQFAQQYFSKVEILSAFPVHSKSDQALTGKRFRKDPVDGKIEWLNKNVGPIKTNLTGNGKEKAIFAKPNAVLIDDKPENIQAFTNAGGIGILMYDPKKVIQQLQQLK